MGGSGSATIVVPILTSNTKVSMSIGFRIAERRKALNITQLDLASRLDISSAFISQLESGLRYPSCDLLMQLVPELQTTADYILFGNPVAKIGNLSYAIEQRLRFIDFLLYQYGSVNRSALVDHFGISTPQASHDISLYNEIAPENTVYDRNEKAYLCTEEFVRVWG